MNLTTLVLVANAGEGSISTFRLVGGVLERLSVTKGLTGCSTFVIDPASVILYLGVKSSGPAAPAGILALDLDRRNGALRPRSRVDLPDGGMNYLALARDGSVLLGVSYSGGYGISCRIDNGTVGEPADRIDFPNLHSVLPSADGRFAYFVSLGADLIGQYEIDDDLRLRPLHPETVSAPQGSGPRHLVINDAQDTVYVLTEFSGEVLRFSRDPATGVIEFRDGTTVVDPAKGLDRGVLGADPISHGYIWGADLHLDSRGSRLWASERTTSTLSAAVVAPDGALSAPERTYATELQPRGFALSPDGSFLVAAGERSTTVSLYAVDGDRLDLLQQAETGRGANWVRFV